MKKYIGQYRKFINGEVCIIDDYDSDNECFFLIGVSRWYNLTIQELIEKTMPTTFLEIVKFRINLIFKR